MAGRITGDNFFPGEYVRDELEARGWTQDDLASILGRPIQAVNEILAGRKAITPATAKGLAKAFGTSPEFWMNLEAAYRLSLTDEEDADVERKAALYSYAPIKDMVKRGWINGSDDADELESEVLSFYGIKSLEETPSFLVAARKSSSYAEMTSCQQAWMCRAMQLARAVPASPFNLNTLRDSLAEVHVLTQTEHDIRQLPRTLGKLGIRFLLLEALPKTRIDGATLWLQDGSPIIVLSTRYDRIDSFWFTLCHELAHVLNGDGWRMDIDLIGDRYSSLDDQPEEERRANREAADFLIPAREIEGFIQRIGPIVSRGKIMQFANKLRIHPGIVVGQLQRRDAIKYSQCRETLVKVRQIAMQSALADGWDTVPQLDI